MTSLKITIGLIAIIILSSCGSSIESDAKDLAKLQCKSQKLAKKIQLGEMDVLDAVSSVAFTLKASELAEKLEEKYTSEEDMKAFQEAVLKAMEDCE